jgi:hypothetical protein
MERSFDPIDSVRRNFGDAFKGRGFNPLETLDFFDSITVTLVIGGALLLICFVILPLLGVALELIVVLAALGFGLFSRVVLRRPWIVEAKPLDGGQTRRFAVRGWRASGRAVEEVATALAAGAPPSPQEAAP